MLGSSVVGSGRLGGRVVGVVVVVVVWLLVVGGGSAWATVGHSFAGQFGGPGSGDGQFGEGGGVGPAGVGVLASTGEVFTADLGQGSGAATPRVQRFSPDGVFVSAFAIDPMYNVIGPMAVTAAGAGAVYVSMNRDPAVGVVAKYSLAGVFAYELDASSSATTINDPAFGAAPLAVDPVDGTVYVTATNSSTGLPVIDRFDGSTGAFINFVDGSGSPEGGFACSPSSLAVDGLQRVYVLDPCKGTNSAGRVDQFSAAGVFGVTVDDGSRGAPSAVAVDPVSDEVYVSEAGPVGVQVTHFSAGGGGVVYSFAASEVGGVRGMAVSGAGTVYTSDSTKPFVEWFTRFDGPTVVTGGVSSVGSRSVVFEGTINPEGVASSYHFEYGGSTDSLGNPIFDQRSPVVGETDAGSGSVAVSATAPAAELQPNKLYYYRLVGSNSSGSIVGAVSSFMTAVAPPDVGPVFASAITPRSVSLHGTVNPNNSFAGWHFEYGTTMAYGSSPPFGGIFFSGGTFQAVASQISGLEPGTLYHFRLVAADGLGTPQFGADQTFFTAPAAGGGATAVTAGRAALTGTVNPHGVPTSYHFNYGPTSNYGASTPEADGGSGDGDQLVSQGVSGLLADRTYHVQVVATSADGVVRAGGDGVFRTAPAPTAVVIGPTGVSTDAATLAGEVNSFGLTGSYHFDVWSLDSSYAISTPERPVAGYASAERVSAAVTGLPAGETFVVQLMVSSNDAVGVSDLLTFATAAVPRVFPTPPASDGTSVYGCGSPRLDAYNARPKPGELITISGRDLGVGGSVVLGDRSLEPVDWSPAGFKVLVPDDGVGTLGLTVNCGSRSNTIAVQIAPKSRVKFSTGNLSTKVLKKAARSGRLPLRVSASSAGKVTLIAKAKFGKKMAQVGRVSKRVKAGKTTKVGVSLNSKARKRLNSGKSLRVMIAVKKSGASTRAISILLPGVPS